MTIFKSKTFNRLFKGLLGIVLLITIYVQVVKRADPGMTWPSFKEVLTWEKSPLLIMAMVLIPINWALESEKWHGLMNRFMVLTRWQSLKSIISGITMGISTPSRIGEYGGRMLFVPAEMNTRAVMTTFVGSVAQNLVNITAGVIGISTFIRVFQPEQVYWSWVMTTIVSAALIILYLFYFNLDFISHVQRRITFLKKKWITDVVSFNLLKAKDLIRVWILSVCRYGVYMSQYVLVAYFFGIDLHGFLALAAISTIFLIQGSMPLPPFIGVLARGEIALIVWGYYGANEFSIIGATYTLWILNVVVPAVVGYFLVLNVDIFTSLGLSTTSLSDNRIGTESEVSRHIINQRES